MKRRVAKAPESVRMWTLEVKRYASPHDWLLCFWARRNRNELDEFGPVNKTQRHVEIVMLRRADYRRLLRAAAGKREAKR
jgi:hypothetical protein